MNKITKAQIQLIHIAKHQLGLDTDLYRDILFNLFGKRSSKDLTYYQGVELINHLKSCGFVIQGRKHIADNIIHLTTPAQRRLIDVLSKRFTWRCRDGFTIWLQRQRDKGFIKSVALNKSSDARWVIEKLKLMTRTTTNNISNCETPHEVG
jgi:hypothetical protein